MRRGARVLSVEEFRVTVSVLTVAGLDYSALNSLRVNSLRAIHVRRRIHVLGHRLLRGLVEGQLVEGRIL